MYDYYTYKNYLSNQFPKLFSAIFAKPTTIPPHAQPQRKYTLRASASDNPVNISSVENSVHKHKNKF